MVLSLIVKKSIDGYTSEIPVIKGCDSWADSEDMAVENVISLLRFYMNLDDSVEIAIDRAYKTPNSTTYKLIFEKD